MNKTGHITERHELDHRLSDGMDVTLLWQPDTRETMISILDGRLGYALEFPVDPASALDAFHHPFAYAPCSGGARSQFVLGTAG